MIRDEKEAREGALGRSWGDHERQRGSWCKSWWECAAVPGDSEEPIVAKSPGLRAEVGGGSRDHSIIHLKNYAHQHSPKRKSTPGVPTLLVQQAPFCLQNRWPLFGGECCFRGSACSDSCCPLLCAIRLWGQVTALSPPATLSVSHLSISVPGVVPLVLHFIKYLISTHFFFFFLA